MPDAHAFLKDIAARTEETLQALLPPESASPTSIHRVMRYSTFAGGKRIRPALIMAAFESCGGPPTDPRPMLACAAIEMLHTFSLMHDDLPCMDDDDMRRGKPTAHKAFSEAIAVLGGDALCIYAFECLCRTGRLDIIQEIAKALGTNGMIGGQVVDIESEGKSVGREVIEYIHQNKTAALITAAVRTGALLADAQPQTLSCLSAYGRHVGLAFQIVDDILDEEGTTEQLGKDAGSDAENRKATYPSVVGMPESKHLAKELIDAAHADLMPLGERAAMLRALADFIRLRVS